MHKRTQKILYIASFLITRIMLTNFSHAHTIDTALWLDRPQASLLTEKHHNIYKETQKQFHTIITDIHKIDHTIKTLKRTIRHTKLIIAKVHKYLSEIKTLIREQIPTSLSETPLTTQALEPTKRQKLQSPKPKATNIQTQKPQKITTKTPQRQKPKNTLKNVKASPKASPPLQKTKRRIPPTSTHKKIKSTSKRPKTSQDWIFKKAPNDSLFTFTQEKNDTFKFYKEYQKQGNKAMSSIFKPDGSQTQYYSTESNTRSIASA